MKLFTYLCLATTFIVLGLLKAEANDFQSLVSTVSSDFRPILGRLISTKKAVFIDLGKREGVRVGDLFGVFVVNTYPQVGHKAVQKRRGFAGTLIVDEVGEARSRCRILRHIRPLPNGSEVERFSGLYACVIPQNRDRPEQFFQLKRRLEKGLWWLNWVSKESLPTSFDSIDDLTRYRLDLAFVISTDGVSVYRAPKVLVRHYHYDLKAATLPETQSKIGAIKINSRALSPMAKLDASAQEVVVGDCDRDGRVELYAICDNVLLYQKQGQDPPIEVRTFASSYLRTDSFSVSCDKRLIAINNLEEGVGLHSSLVACGTFQSVATDINLWLRFLDRGARGGQLLLGEEFSATKEGKVKRLHVVRPDEKGGLVYERDITVPWAFTLKNGYILGDYSIYRDEMGRWMVGAISDERVVWTKKLDTSRLKGAAPLFFLAKPLVRKDSKRVLIVPVYFQENDTSRLFMIDPQGPSLSFFSEPVEGKVVGFDLLGERIYLAIRSMRGEQTVLLTGTLE